MSRKEARRPGLGAAGPVAGQITPVDRRPTPSTHRRDSSGASRPAIRAARRPGAWSIVLRSRPSPRAPHVPSRAAPRGRPDPDRRTASFNDCHLHREAPGARGPPGLPRVRPPPPAGPRAAPEAAPPAAAAPGAAAAPRGPGRPRPHRRQPIRLARGPARPCSSSAPSTTPPAPSSRSTSAPPRTCMGILTLLQRLAERHGLPVTLYGDRLGVFVRNDAHWSLEEELQARSIPPSSARSCGTSASATSPRTRPRRRAASNASGPPSKIGSSPSCTSTGSTPWSRPRPTCPHISPTTTAASPTPRRARGRVAPAPPRSRGAAELPLYPHRRPRQHRPPQPPVGPDSPRPARPLLCRLPRRGPRMPRRPPAGRLSGPPLCARMDETVPPSEITVEGGKGYSHGRAG